MPFSLAKVSASQLTIVWSMSRPPRWESPSVDLTSITSSPTSKIEMSKVPPPKSKTAICLSLRVVKVSWHGNPRFGNFFTEASFSVGFHFLKNHRRDLLWPQPFLSILRRHFYFNTTTLGFPNFKRNILNIFLHSRVIKVMTHKSFNLKYRILGIGHRLPFCEQANQALAGFALRHNGRGCSLPFRIF